MFNENDFVLLIVTGGKNYFDWQRFVEDQYISVKAKQVPPKGALKKHWN